MFGADIKVLFGKDCLNIWLRFPEKIFPEGQKWIFSVHWPAHLNQIGGLLLKIIQFLGNYWWILYLVILCLDKLIQSDMPKRFNF